MSTAPGRAAISASHGSRTSSSVDLRRPARAAPPPRPVRSRRMSAIVPLRPCPVLVVVGCTVRDLPDTRPTPRRTRARGRSAGVRCRSAASAPRSPSRRRWWCRGWAARPATSHVATVAAAGRTGKRSRQRGPGERGDADLAGERRWPSPRPAGPRPPRRRRRARTGRRGRPSRRRRASRRRSAEPASAAVTRRSTAVACPPMAPSAGLDGDDRLRPADVLRAVQRLPVQVRDVSTGVVVDDDQLADAGGGEHRQQRAAEPAGADDDDPGGREALPAPRAPKPGSSACRAKRRIEHLPIQPPAGRCRGCGR